MRYLTVNTSRNNSISSGELIRLIGKRNFDVFFFILIETLYNNIFSIKEKENSVTVLLLLVYSICDWFWKYAEINVFLY